MQLGRAAAVVAVTVFATACDAAHTQVAGAQSDKRATEVGDALAREGVRVRSVTPIKDDSAQGSQQQIGRYAFYIDPSSPQNLFGGGYVLDTATGELWVVSYETENGKRRPVLVPISRTQTTETRSKKVIRYDVNGNVIPDPTPLSAEELIKKYSR